MNLIALFILSFMAGAALGLSLALLPRVANLERRLDKTERLLKGMADPQAALGGISSWKNAYLAGPGLTSPVLRTVPPEPGAGEGQGAI